MLCGNLFARAGGEEFERRAFRLHLAPRSLMGPSRPGGRVMNWNEVRSLLEEFRRRQLGYLEEKYRREVEEENKTWSIRGARLEYEWRGRDVFVVDGKETLYDMMGNVVGTKNGPDRVQVHGKNVRVPVYRQMYTQRRLRRMHKQKLKDLKTRYEIQKTLLEIAFTPVIETLAGFDGRSPANLGELFEFTYRCRNGHKGLRRCLEKVEAMILETYYSRKISPALVRIETARLRKKSGVSLCA
jgi:hypothetical protein